jgi:hypothetical protein
LARKTKIGISKETYLELARDFAGMGSEILLKKKITKHSFFGQT